MAESVPNRALPVGRLVLALLRTSRCCLPVFRYRRPPQEPYFRGSITQPTCSLSTLHDAGRPNAAQDSLPVCWLDVDWAGFAPAGFQSRISRGRTVSYPNEPDFAWRTGKFTVSALARSPLTDRPVFKSLFSLNNLRSFCAQLTPQGKSPDVSGL